MAAPDADKLIDDLSAYLDGELDADRVHEINALLERSPDARRHLDDLRQIAVELRAMPRAVAPDDLPAAILRGSHIGQRKNALGIGRELYPRLGQYTGVAAAAMLFFGLGTLIGPYLPRMSRVESSTEQPPLITNLTPKSPAASDFTVASPANEVARAPIDYQRLKSLGYAGESHDDESPTISAEESVVVAGRTGAGSSGHVVAVDGDAAETTRADNDNGQSDGPIVNIVVNTRTPEEFANAQHEVNNWNDVAKNPKARATRIDAGVGDSVDVATQQVLSANVRPARANKLIGILQQQLPDGVEVSVAFNASQSLAAERLVRSTNTRQAYPQLEPAVAARETGPEERDAGRAYGGAVPVDPPAPTASAATALAAGPPPARAAAPARRESERDEPKQDRERSGYAYIPPSTAPAATSPAVAGRGGARGDARKRADEPVAKSTSSPATPVPAAEKPATYDAGDMSVRRGLAASQPEAYKDTATTNGYQTFRGAAVSVLRAVDRVISDALGDEPSTASSLKPGAAAAERVDSTDPNFPHVAVKLQVIVHAPPTMSAPATSAPGLFQPVTSAPTP